MASAARRAYETDVIVRTLARHLDKTSLMTMMMVEQKGDLFDWCVNELYSEVNHDNVHDMTWSSVSQALYPIKNDVAERVRKERYNISMRYGLSMPIPSRHCRACKLSPHGWTEMID